MTHPYRSLPPKQPNVRWGATWWVKLVIRLQSGKCACHGIKHHKSRMRFDYRSELWWCPFDKCITATAPRGGWQFSIATPQVGQIIVYYSGDDWLDR